MTGGAIGINSIAHGVALESLTEAIQVVRNKGYKNVNVVSHSWGTVLSRDALNEEGGKINTWVTMGSPLSATTGKPSGVGNWLNIWCPNDPVVHLGPTQLTGLGYGRLFNKDSIDQQELESVGPITDLANHETYWTDPVSLNRIGNYLKPQ